MPITALHTLPSRPHAAARSLVDAAGCWSRVQVISARIASSRGANGARAVIQLGGLTPADVRVIMMPIGPSVATGSPSEHRMFSCQAYDNGCFVFEAYLSPADTAGVRDWSIHVHAREPITLPPVTHRFRAPE